MAKTSFVYATYIRTTPEKLWRALTHEIDKPDSKLIEALSGGWPLILASLKSLLETGQSLEATRTWPKDV